MVFLLYLLGVEFENTCAVFQVLGGSQLQLMLNEIA